MSNGSIREPHRRRIRVSPLPIDTGGLVDEVSGPSSGAIALFLGTVRDHSPGKQGITHLDYEAYEGHVEAQERKCQAAARSMVVRCAHAVCSL